VLAELVDPVRISAPRTAGAPTKDLRNPVAIEGSLITRFNFPSLAVMFQPSLSNGEHVILETFSIEMLNEVVAVIRGKDCKNLKSPVAVELG
jgi:hypothetical protein